MCRYVCTKCGKPIKVGRENMRRTLKCPKCKGEVYYHLTSIQRHIADYLVSDHGDLIQDHTALSEPPSLICELYRCNVCGLELSEEDVRDSKRSLK